MDNQKNIRARYFTFILYPDNPYHMQFLDYLEASHDGFYILHEAGADNYSLPLPAFQYEQHTEKSHFHVVVRFKNPRTVSGFMKKIPYVKYFKALPLENLNDETKSRFYTIYDISCVDIPVEEVYKQVVEHVEPISDIYGYAQYMLHRDFDSYVRGKHQYSLGDVKPLCCDITAVSQYFYQTEQTDNDILDAVLQICSCADGDKNLFVQLVQMHTNPNVLKYVQKHAYFVDKYVLSPNKRIAVMEDY